jgi:hypothetical protein
MQVNEFLEKSRLITCVLPDDGTDRKLMSALRTEKRISTVNSKQCRGISMLRGSVAKPGKLPESELVRMVEVIVPDATCEELFTFVSEVAEMDKPGGGIMWMGQVVSATRYDLGTKIADE